MASGGPEVLHQRPPVSPDVPSGLGLKCIQEGLSGPRPPEAVCNENCTTFISISDHHKKTNLYSCFQLKKVGFILNGSSDFGSELVNDLY